MDGKRREDREQPEYKPKYKESENYKMFEELLKEREQAEKKQKAQAKEKAKVSESLSISYPFQSVPKRLHISAISLPKSTSLLTTLTERRNADSEP